jgi:hypothetical protein
MFLLAFVNHVRRAQKVDPLTTLELGDVTALESALHCRLEPTGMRFPRPEVAAAVAADTGLPLTGDPATVALPPALRGYVGRCASRAAVVTAA